MYTERTTPDITIYRPSLTGTDEAVQTVPITEDSKRVFALMSEDYVELHFTLAEAMHFEVGDYINDELFGQFVITTKQMPSYDTATGGYTYSLKFERPYRKWKNWKNRLIATVTDNDTQTVKRVRKETNWSLTANLKTHAEEILSNLQVIGDTTDGTHSYELDLTGGGEATVPTYSTKAFAAGEDTLSWAGIILGANTEDGSKTVTTAPEKAGEVKNISYDGTSILDALTAIADAYECEWWVTYESDGMGGLRGIIHFGKCEDNTTDETTLTLGDNVESMTIQDDNSTFCNRLYAYGATTNVPSSYRKTLAFKVAAVRGTGSGTEFLPVQKITLPMLAGGAEYAAGFRSHYAYIYAPTPGLTPSSRWFNGFVEYSVKCKDATAANRGGQITSTGTSIREDANRIDTLGGTFTFEGAFTFRQSLPVFGTITEETTGNISVPVTVEVFIEDSSGKSVATLYTAQETLTVPAMSGYTHIVDVDFAKECTLPSGTFHIVLRVVYTSPVLGDDESGYYTARPETTYNTITAEGSDTESCIRIDDGTTTRNVLLTTMDGGGYNAEFYQLAATESEGDWAGRVAFRFNNEGYQHLHVGDTFTLPYYNGSTGVLINKIPLSWFASDYDNPTAICQIGDNRLMLPEDTGGYLQPDTDLTRDQIVEMAVTFDEIYPRCVLQVTDITEVEKKQEEEYEDGSKTYWDWTQYRLLAKNLNGDAFRFKKAFVKDGETLKIKFLTESEMAEAYDALGVAADKRTYPDGGYRLAGMTFEVNFKNLSQLYTIVRNEDYGALFPNDTLRPTVGDPLILVGWDVRAMGGVSIGGLGLLDEAEQRLQKAAEEYLEAIKEDQFTFTCQMMSEAPSDEAAHTVFITKDGEMLHTKDGERFLVKSKSRWYSLLNEGSRACVRHGALTMEDGHGIREKHSRVIGYELKLDMPYDTPKYTIGDTEAYSRIKRMEKELTKLGNS